MENQTPITTIIINEEFLEEYAKNYVEEFYTKKLKKEWYSIQDLMYITGYKRAWIKENIIDHPYIRNKGIAKKHLNPKKTNVKAEWRCDSRVIDFIRSYHEKLPTLEL